MSRPQQRKLPKTKTPKKKQKDPETFDEFLSEGITCEEQGERYATGERAQRNYEKAATMYSKASALNDKDADCVYNWGRVLYILVGFYPAHATPEEKLKTLDQSIEKFRRALSLDPTKTDAHFNLGQALHMRSELLQDTTEIANSYTQSATALQEAISIFESVYAVQEKEYNDQHAAPPKDNDDNVQSTSSSDNEPNNKDDNKDEYTTVTEVEPTTAYSLIDTLVSLADAMTTMASMLASYQSAVDLYSRARKNLSQAEKWLMVGTSTEDKEHKQARIQISLKEAQNLSSQAERSFLATNKVDHRLFNQAVDQLDMVLEHVDSQHVETHCDRGDILSTFGDHLCKEAKAHHQSLDPETTGKSVWHIYSQADKSFKAALEKEPKNMSILNKLGDLSMSRARLDIPVAERNRSQLIKNAEFYFKRAVETDRQVLTTGWIGWAYSTWALEQWTKAQGQKNEASRIMKTWIKRGGCSDLFAELTEDTDAIDQDFLEWVNESFFDDEEEEETSDEE
ncbi:hypothetical protein O0I10_005097 [Lichtheimia ornata]|uniref:TPR-like protein n=1 Tax=Lichtheimia ornata TaxID=688661 RepID=A0AAD7XVZ5_9FUNG|nr:uncharacterized protein O0I10_005097 [Lichtheimia ornata]KAJ8659059.1 hypothetical protein O0I10_005097 [Lichtheimia ornata]